MDMDYSLIRQRLTDKYGPETIQIEESRGMMSVIIPASQVLEFLQFLFEDNRLRFRFLTDLTAVHYPDLPGAELQVVYHLHNLVDNIRLRVKAHVPVADPSLPSVTPLYQSANWMERETYDFFGVQFVGHPQLTRILNVDEMDYFPMRKEYPLEDPTRVDKDDEMFGRGGIVIEG